MSTRQIAACTPTAIGETGAVLATLPIHTSRNHIFSTYQDGMVANCKNQHHVSYASKFSLPSGNVLASSSQSLESNPQNLVEFNSFEAAMNNSNVSYSLSTNNVTCSNFILSSSIPSRGLTVESAPQSVRYPYTEDMPQHNHLGPSNIAIDTGNLQSGNDLKGNRDDAMGKFVSAAGTTDTDFRETNSSQTLEQGSPAKSRNNSAQLRSPRKRRKKTAKKEETKPQEQPVCIVLSDGEDESQPDGKDIKTDPLFDLLLYIISTGSLYFLHGASSNHHVSLGDLGGGQTVFQLHGGETLLVASVIK